MGLPDTHLSGIGFSLYDVQDTDVATRFTWRRRDHAILGLQEPSHNIEDCCFTHGLRLLDVVTREGRVGGHEEVAARGWNERGDDTN